MRVLAFFKSVMFWFLVVCAVSVIILYVNFFTKIECEIDVWKDVYQLISSLMVGLLTSFFFYYLVVYIPKNNKNKIVKSNFMATYLDIKREILFDIVSYSKETRGAISTDLIDKLMNAKDFYKHFKNSDGSHNGKFYTFVNHITNNKEDFLRIISNLQILSKMVSYILNNYQIKDKKLFDTLRNYELFLLRINFIEQESDDIKIFTRFIWQIYAGFCPEHGQINYDIFEKTISEI